MSDYRRPSPGQRPPPLPAQSRVQPPPLPSLAERLTRLRKPPPPDQALLTPDELERFRNLLIFARSMVEGYFVGKHKSPHRGSSVEFTDYKEYVPGDELNRLDWRAYGRSKKLFIRQYEAETDMVAYLLVDTSASMSYGGERRKSKYIMAAKIAAALAYLMLHQGDKAALGLFSISLNKYLPPGGTRRHLHNMITELEQIRPSSQTGMAEALQQCASLFRKRGRVIILSDFWTDQSQFMDALAQLIHRKYEILLLHVLDPDELNLPDLNAARFEDLETREKVQVEVEDIRHAYRENVKKRIEELAREANDRRVDYTVVDTRNPYIDAIETYLGFRGKNPYTAGR